MYLVKCWYLPLHSALYMYLFCGAHIFNFAHTMVALNFSIQASQAYCSWRWLLVAPVVASMVNIFRRTPTSLGTGLFLLLFLFFFWFPQRTSLWSDGEPTQGLACTFHTSRDSRDPNASFCLKLWSNTCGNTAGLIVTNLSTLSCGISGALAV